MYLWFINDAVSISDSVTSNDGIISEWSFEKDVDEACVTLVWSIGEDHQEFIKGKLISGLVFDHGPPDHQSRAITTNWGTTIFSTTATKKTSLHGINYEVRHRTTFFVLVSFLVP
jgi:hypothetical protein